MEMEGSTVGPKPGDNGGQQKGGVGVAERPGLAGVLQQKTQAPQGKTATQSGYKTNQDVQAKRDRIEALNKRRRQNMRGESQLEAVQDEVKTIEEETRESLEEKILEGKTGLRKYVTMAGLKLRLISPEKTLKKGRKNIEAQLRVYQRQYDKIEVQIARGMKELDQTRAKLEDCYECDTLTKEMMAYERTALGKLKDEVREGLAKKEDVAQKRAEVRGKEQYIKRLQKNLLENAFESKQYESSVKKMESELGRFTTRQKETLHKTYSLKRRVPDMKSAETTSEEGPYDARRDVKVKEDADRMSNLAEEINKRNQRLTVARIKGRIDWDYIGDGSPSERKELEAATVEAEGEFDKDLQQMVDSVEVKKAEYYDKI